MTSSHRPVMIVGDVFNTDDERLHAPFVGGAGKMLAHYLHTAGYAYPKRTNGNFLDWSSHPEVYVTNIFHKRPRPTASVLNLLTTDRTLRHPDYPKISPRHWLPVSEEHELSRLHAEIATIQPNIILALGPIALNILTHDNHKFASARGTMHFTPTGIKVIPTHHPNAVVRDYSLNPYVTADIRKMKRNSLTPSFARPRREIWMDPTFADMERFRLKYMLNPERPCGVDIETKLGTITEIGFGYPEAALVVPFYARAARSGNYWPSPTSEHRAWDWVRSILAHLHYPVFQNGLYDLAYLMRMSIPVPYANEDTMLLHHALYPELKKGLGMLGSLYTEEVSWKLMRKATTLKKEE